MQRNISTLISDNTEDTSIPPFDLPAIKTAAKKFLAECGLRELNRTKRWLSELNHSLDLECSVEDDIPELEIDSNNYETYLMACTLIPVREYARGSFFLKNVDTDRANFMNFYCMYKMLDQNKPMDFTNMNTTTKSDYYACMRKLFEMLDTFTEEHKEDGFTYYLKGLVSSKLGNKISALDSFCKAVNRLPLLWEAWDELSNVIDDRVTLSKLNLPNHWMKEFFLAQTYVKIQRNDDAFTILWNLHDNGFNKNFFVLSKIATVYYNKRDIDNALNFYKRIHEEDPFRLEDLDKYANLLHVCDMKKELAYLAHHVFSVNRYTAEACCVVADYFSKRRDHAKAAAYFQRAVKLNSNYMSTLILRGHEFMEMKNTRGAITCYRDVISVDPQDYRAWYGLGQTYEIIKLPFYALHYHKRAQLIRPDDSLILIAMGEVYEKMNRFGEALRCYKRARNVGDSDSSALSHLAKLYTELDNEQEAAAAYKQLVKETEGTAFSKEYADAYRYLAHHHLKLNQFHSAFQFAQLCLNFEETKEEGKALLKEIATRRDMEESKHTESHFVNSLFSI